MTVKQSRSRRWADRTFRFDSQDTPQDRNSTPQPAARHPRERVTERGLGPYESSYDISLGYGMDRPVIIP